MNLTPIFNIAEICHQHGLKDAVLSPGSRCAPLTLAFTRHRHIACKTISDERSAAFIALGMSQQSHLPTILVCTSGSATLNYAPAIAEAYFQQVPMLVFTADRPPEWIDQYDGQTIRQTNIYGSHIKKSFSLPTDPDHQDAQWHCYRIISEAINEAKRFPQGPVHVNIPFREPFYPGQGEQTGFDANIKIFTETTPSYHLPETEWQLLIEAWQNSNRKLIIGGQADKAKELIPLLDYLSEKQKIPILGDVISNLHEAKNIIAHSDIFLGQAKKGIHESLQPDLIVTFGKSTISKNLKLFLRKFPAVAHWHIQPAGDVADTFKSLTKIIRTTPDIFFNEVSTIEHPAGFNTRKRENYYHLWEIEERKAKRLLGSFFPQEPLGEFEVVAEVLNNASNINLHLANSMAVRYANFVGLAETKGVEVFANRGTSGIDGSTSTAVGASLLSEKDTILITGDMAFFYDRNAFWHNYPLHHLKIVILNNHAGGIFRMITGPSEQPELEEYFETRQQLTAKKLAEEFDIHYINCDKRSKLKNHIREFFECEGPVILEVESESKNNKATLDAFKAAFKAQD